MLINELSGCACEGKGEEKTEAEGLNSLLVTWGQWVNVASRANDTTVKKYNLAEIKFTFSPTGCSIYRCQLDRLILQFH